MSHTSVRDGPYARLAARRALSALLSLAAFAVISAPEDVNAAGPVRYEFVNVADSSGPLDNLGFGFPSINNNGMVSFRGTYKDGGWGLFAGSSRGGPLTTLIDSRVGGLVRYVSGEPHGLNDAGTIAFQGGLEDGRIGVFTVAPSGALTTVFSGFGPAVGVPENPPVQRYPVIGYKTDIDGAGAAVFWTRDADGVTSIRKGAGGAITTVVDTRGDLKFLGQPAMNQSGTVSFFGSPDGEEVGVYVADAAGVRRVWGAPEGRRFDASSTATDINDLGAIAIEGGGIVAPDGTFTTIGGEGQPGSPAINNAGAIAFYSGFGEYPNNTYGVYTGSNPVADKVIAKGDPLFGATATGMSVFGGGMNDRGEIVFKYSVSGGRYGIAVARPVPEPASLWPLALAALAMRRPCVA